MRVFVFFFRRSFRYSQAPSLGAAFLCCARRLRGFRPFCSSLKTAFLMIMYWRAISSAIKLHQEFVTCDDFSLTWLKLTEATPGLSQEASSEQRASAKATGLLRLPATALRYELFSSCSCSLCTTQKPFSSEICTSDINSNGSERRETLEAPGLLRSRDPPLGLVLTALR